MRIRPLADRLVVEPIASEGKLASGLIIPESRRDKEKKGKVIAVGPKVIEVQEGDVILFGMHAGTELTKEKINYRIMPEHEVFAVLEE